ncbi:hypothetical protein KDK_76370 [Dictyobacter kobayashii]|uniref:Uncharacterized protein n=1 Tax=Dictyobacter kobayashii TaxID=2014872 RepID=A0A402AXM0_9CHLR|nr:hypothetical protein KDK_76370 [Dictyobacter kobayashii]
MFFSGACGAGLGVWWAVGGRGRPPPTTTPYRKEWRLYGLLVISLQFFDEHEKALTPVQGFFMFVQRIYIFQVWSVWSGLPQQPTPHTPNPAPQAPKRNMKKP